MDAATFAPQTNSGADASLADAAAAEAAAAEAPATTAPGSGLGLAIVRQLTEAMGGQVSVRNRPPGVEFSIRLPEA
jgi:signal transduction histidine kinase